MAKNLIVVESPAKAKTITKYLGKDFKALASYGHVRDLLPKTGAVDPDDNFAMKYEIIERNEKHVDAIVKEIKKADALYLATDPDREGEAISWHLKELLEERNLLEGKDVHRVAFYEITKDAIIKAVENPRTLSDELINAQMARRALDYLVGFNLSPLLWKKVRPGLSAGRVQSPALRLICEREAEIRKFEPREYWSVEADLEESSRKFLGRLTHFADDKLSQFSVVNEKQAGDIETELLAKSNGKLTVRKVDKKKRKRNPAPPFTTSTLQQEASRKIGFGAQRTMRVAQQLYEGVALEGETAGLITYMRTDSVNLAASAIDEVRAVIATRFGENNVPETPQSYKNRSKNAQEAHEAVRPTDPTRSPDLVKPFLKDDQFKLYDLIWKRTIACQMIHATLDTVAVDMEAGDGTGHIFRANGSTIVDPGFMAVYQEDADDKNPDSDKQVILPELKEGQSINVEKIRTEQHFTEPPPRYTEASLVKTLEAYGIGRPSTYASIISTLVSRDYVELESRRFRPTDVGLVVSLFLTNHFGKYVDYDFTARMEDDLDAVSRGEKKWVPLMEEFWAPFRDQVDEKEETVSREEAVQARHLGTDPESGRPVTVRMARYGPIVQIGTKDDEEKPLFRGLVPGQRMDDVTYEEGMELFTLPREIGETPEGEKMSTNFGRFGPYVKYGSKFVSLKDGDPFKVTHEEALVLVEEKKEFDRNKVVRVWEEEGIEVLRGHFGPYVTDGEKNAKIPKDVAPESLTLEQCKEMIAKAPVRRSKKKKKKAAGKKKASAAADAEAAGTTTKKKAKKKTKAKKKAKKKTKAKKKAKAKAKKKATAKKATSKTSPEPDAGAATAAEQAGGDSAVDD